VTWVSSLAQKDDESKVVRWEWENLKYRKSFKELQESCGLQPPCHLLSCALNWNCHLHLLNPNLHLPQGERVLHRIFNYTSFPLERELNWLKAVISANLASQEVLLELGKYLHWFFRPYLGYY